MRTSARQELPGRSGRVDTWIAAAVALLQIAAPVAWADTNASLVTRGPYLQSAGTTTMTLRWRTSVEADSAVQLGEAPDALAPAASVTGTRTEHVVQLTSLQPGTRYYYRCGGTATDSRVISVDGAERWFRTAPAVGAESGRFWALGCSGTHYPAVPFYYVESKRASDLFISSSRAAGKPVNGLILLGDNAYNLGADSEYQAAVFVKYGEMIKTTPVWSAFGNHDAYTLPSPFTGPAPYDGIFSFPRNGECGGLPSGSLRYYSFNHGGIHFVCLDNNTLGYYDTVPGGGGMVDWLLADLVACQESWIVAFFHHPPYSKGGHDSDTEWNLVRVKDHIVPMLERFGVDLVLCAHSHSYERSVLLDGQYGRSTTYDAVTMRKWPGNGSKIGAVGADGAFVKSPALAGGAYQKRAAAGRSGAIYVVNGGSGKLDPWLGGSTAVVNPAPHPVHCVSLRVIGGLMFEVAGNGLHAEYRDDLGNVRDEFNIIKGSTFRLEQPVLLPEGGGGPGGRVRVRRSGALGLPDEVVVALTSLAGTSCLPATRTVSFAAGQAYSDIVLAPPEVGIDCRVRLEFPQVGRALEVGTALRPSYWVQGAPVELVVAAALVPASAADWYAVRFGAPPADRAVWDESAADGDGMDLLLEYALGGEPGRNDSDLLPQIASPGGIAEVSYSRPPGRSDLTYSVEISDDLAGWQSMSGLDQPAGDAGPWGQLRKIVLPANAVKKFVRLAVHLDG
ncbi:MAG: metallophosphoesterase family protein [Verrucomicrobia bacterium]|nr:metallophosphoesterase family protein [Verrucomicrobiota bacterium]